jgi:ribosomal protein S27AE
MKYIVGGIFLAFIISFVYVLKMNRKATVKRRAYRWCVGLFSLFLFIFMASTVEHIALMVFGTPVIAWLAFGWLRYMKFCDWCGKAVNIIYPFLADKKHCPRCGSNIL